MALQKRRSRIVSFRLSPEEYDSLKSFSATHGARSVSEFTRSVACLNNKSDAEKGAIEQTLRLISEKVDTINEEVRKLARAYEEKEQRAPDATPPGLAETKRQL
jgi:hypothetical protein